MVFLLAVLYLVSVVSAHDTLIFAIELARHGARFPKLKLFPWNIDPMGLTPAGMRQHYILGRELRNRYINLHNLLDVRYNPTQILLRSTQNKRTLASIYAQLAGIYVHGTGNVLLGDQYKTALPPNKGNYINWIKEMGIGAVDYIYQILPVKSMEKSIDTYLEPQEACPTLKEVIKHFEESHESYIKEMEDKFEGLYQELSKAVNISIAMNASYAVEVRDVIICGLVEGKLDITEKYALELIQKSAPIYQHARYDMGLLAEHEDYLVSKLIATPFLQKVKQLLVNAAQEDFNAKEPKLKFVLDMASDTLLHSVLLQMGHNRDKKGIPFASAMFFELYRNKSQSKGGLEDYYIRFILNNQINITYSFNELLELIESSTYTEVKFEEYCYNYTIDDIDNQSMLLWILLGIGLAIVLFAGLLIALKKHARERKVKGVDEASLSDNYSTSV